MPKVYHHKDPNCPPDAVWVDRRSLYGNPFRIGQDGTREQVVQKYREWLEEKSFMKEEIKARLRGCDLKCHCKPKACHGDVILEVANADNADK